VSTHEVVNLALRLHELLQQFKYDFEGDRHGKENESDPRQEARFEEDRGSETTSTRAARPDTVKVLPRPLLSHFRLAGVFAAPTVYARKTTGIGSNWTGAGRLAKAASEAVSKHDAWLVPFVPEFQELCDRGRGVTGIVVVDVHICRDAALHGRMANINPAVQLL
jgi:hypothetical protein